MLRQDEKIERGMCSPTPNTNHNPWGASTYVTPPTEGVDTYVARPLTLSITITLGQGYTYPASFSRLQPGVLEKKLCKLEEGAGLPG